MFHVEVLSPQAQPISRRVDLTITAVQADGSIATVVDPDSGEIHPGPLVIKRTTPWTHTSTLGPGVVAVSLTVDYLGNDKEIVVCYATVGGSEISRDEDQVRGGPGGRGYATASCEALTG